MTIQEAVEALPKFCPSHKDQKRIGVNDGQIYFTCGCHIKQAQASERRTGDASDQQQTK